MKYKAQISIVDPLAISEARRVLGNKVLYAESIEDALRGSDLCVLGLNYEEFNQITEKITLMKSPKILDLCDHEIRNVLKDLKNVDVIYRGILW